MDTKVIEHAELDPFTDKIKSSVKLIKNSRGVGWEVRVVSGEENLIDGLMKAAVKVHNDLEKMFVKVAKEIVGLKNE